MRAICLGRYPDGPPDPADFDLRELPDPVPGAGEVLVRVTHLSMDPLPRVRMSATPSLGAPMALGAPVEGRGVGIVIESRADGFRPGDPVIGELGWQTRAALPADRLARIEGGQPHQHLNALGPTGLAAWFAIERLDPRGGETLLVAPAAGAVGSLACQIARARAPGLRIVAGVLGAAQAAFAAAQGHEPIDCAAADWSVPGGVDAAIDGVGGAFHEQLLVQIKPRARLLLLGYVSGYGGGPPRYGNAGAILMKRARMEGFLLADHMDRAGQARRDIETLLADGRLRPVERIHRGLAAAPAAFASLFGAAVPGKQIVELEED